MLPKNVLCYTVVMLCPVVVLTLPPPLQFQRYSTNTTSQFPDSFNQNFWTNDQGFPRSCSYAQDPKRIRRCMKNAASVGNKDDEKDLKFFRVCIFELYCFEHAIVAGVNILRNLPSFRGVVGTPYFVKASKRVERFFVRNNDWSQTLKNAKFRNTINGECRNLLDVIAARYLYMVHVLDFLKYDQTFAPCSKSEDGRLKVPTDGVCFIVPSNDLSCTSDFHIALLGKRSGSLTALFNRFFREPVRPDQTVTGFGKAVEEIFDANVHAFTLEYAMPELFSELSDVFRGAVTKMNKGMNSFIQEVVVAIMKMNSRNSKYCTDLYSDQVILGDKPTAHNLLSMFKTWFFSFEDLRKSVKSLSDSDGFRSITNFRGKQNVEYNLIREKIGLYGVTEPAATALAETAITLLYVANAYHTRGGLRHVVSLTAMLPGQRPSIEIRHHWLSMLENWSNAVEVHGRQCVKNVLRSVECLPKMVNYLWRMADAMHMIYTTLNLAAEPRNDFVVMETASGTGTRSILRHWLINVKDMGLDAIPEKETKFNPPKSNRAYFFTSFNCPNLRSDERFTSACMDTIQAEIRKYNRRLFRYLVDHDPKRQ